MMFRAKSFSNLIKLPFYSTQRFASSNVLQALKDRTLIRVSGDEVTEYLQGLITNDIKHLDSGPGAMFSMVLNTKGRVLYDTLIYRTEENNVFYIECDKEALQPLQRHLKMYRVRRKISVDSMDDSMKVFTIFNPNTEAQTEKPIDKSTKLLEGLIIPCDALQETQPESKASTKFYRDLILYRDPRISLLGARVLAPAGCDVSNQIKEVMNVDTENTSETYKKFRYRLGVGEGVLDLPPGDCFPLEANCDYLHGVSFHKGCYVGQELTARTYHTGVVRKRLMPLIFSKVPTKFPEDSKIVVNNTNLGKFRGVEGNVGLGLLRIAQALGCENITIGDGAAHTVKPSWWPLEAPKEKISAQKSS